MSGNHSGPSLGNSAVPSSFHGRPAWARILSRHRGPPRTCQCIGVLPGPASVTDPAPGHARALDRDRHVTGVMAQGNGSRTEQRI
jgi:hypothetical protein